MNLLDIEITLTVEVFVATAIIGYFLIGNILLRVSSFWIHSLINFVGTITHELLHYLVALITFAKPVSFSIFPKKNGNQWIFGQVACANLKWYNAFPVGMAPILIMTIPYFAGTYYNGTVMPILDALVLLFPTAIVCLAAFPSTQDFKVAASKPIGSSLWILAIIYLLFPTQTIDFIQKLI